jgi:hypothetical protein
MRDVHQQINGSAAYTGPHDRKFVRYRVSVRCEFSSDPCTGDGTVVDLSTGGCKVESAWRFAPGEYLSMTLHAVSLEHALPVELAVVRWASGEAFGVEFIRIGPIHQKRLGLLVGYIEQDAMLLAGLKASL